MLDSEEQVQQRLPIPLPKAKFWSPGNSEEESDDEATTVTPIEGNPEVPSSSTQSLAYQIHVVIVRFDVYWDES